MANEFLVATFDGQEALLEAVTKVRAHGFRIYDVYTPFPVHGLDHALGLRRSRLGYVTCVAAVLGLSAALAFQFYAAVFDWSLNVGGKPDNSTLAFVPIAFELTILAGGLATAAAFVLRAGLFPGAAIAWATAGAAVWVVLGGYGLAQLLIVLRRRLR